MRDMSKMDRRTLQKNIIAYCEKNENEIALKQLMEAAKLFQKMYDEKEYKELQDMDWDKALTVLAILRCKDEGALRRIFIITKQLIK